MPKFALLSLLVSTMPGIRAWGDDLVVVLFEFWTTTRSCRIPSRRAVLHPAAQHVVLAALRRCRLPQLQELHPDAGERHACPLRHRRLLPRPGHEQSMAAPVFGRVGISCSHGLVREEPGVDNWMASLARRQQRRVPRGRRRGRGTPRPR